MLNYELTRAIEQTYSLIERTKPDDPRYNFLVESLRELLAEQTRRALARE
ncbi:MAG TPA: hypothetical protein VED01_07740 [Burkholderiales bacterium]|nr:hypothetical protein [Burkholderiales bacterium]